MPSQVISLGTNPLTISSRWTGAVLVDPSLIDGGGTAYLREFGLSDLQSSVILRLAANATDDPVSAGPEFTPALEISAVAITLEEVGGNSFVLTGPNYQGTVFADQTEPYDWNPNPPGTSTVIDGLTDWINGIGSGEVTLTLDDVSVVLSDMPTDDLEIEALGNITASSLPDIWARSPRTAEGVLNDGEMDIDGDNARPLTRLRVLDFGARIALNDSNSGFNLRDYFETGDGSDLSVYFQLGLDDDDLIDFPIAGNIQSGSSIAISINIPLDHQAAIGGIAENSVFNFMLARSIPKVRLSGNAASGILSTSASISVDPPSPSRLSGNAASGNLSTSANIKVKPFEIAYSGSANSGVLSTSANIRIDPPPPLRLSGNADSGNLSTSAGISIGLPLPSRLSGSAASGTLSTSASIRIGSFVVRLSGKC